MTWLVIISFAAVLAALLLRYRTRRRAADLGIDSELLYVAAERGEVLISDGYGLIGRSDYIIDVAGESVPIERKSRRASSSGPHESEVLQLAA